MAKSSLPTHAASLSSLSSLGLCMIVTLTILVIAANLSPRACLEGNSYSRLPLARFPPSATALLCHAGMVPPRTA